MKRPTHNATEILYNTCKVAGKRPKIRTFVRRSWRSWRVCRARRKRHSSNYHSAELSTFISLINDIEMTELKPHSKSVRKRNRHRNRGWHNERVTWKKHANLAQMEHEETQLPSASSDIPCSLSWRLWVPLYATKATSCETTQGHTWDMTQINLVMSCKSYHMTS